MKKLFVILLMFISSSVFAGDLYVNCYQNEDEGDYVALSEAFMDDNKIALTFDYNDSLYTVVVTRRSMFDEYKYKIFKTDSNGEMTVTTKQSPKYNYPVKVDDYINCVTND